MDFKTMAITATLGGTILLSGLTFTGAIDLQSIKGFGQDWANKLTQAVNNSKDMASKFNIFKSDAERLINEKIAEINSLNARISELGDKVASGEVNLEDANNEIARLNIELEKANTEVEALKNEFASKDAEVQTTFNEMVTADSLDTNLTLDNQTTTPATPEETPETPEEEPTPEEPQGYTAQETAIYNAMTTKYTGLEDLQVTITDNTITLVEPNLNVHSAFGDGYITTIEQASSIDITQSQKISDTTFKYTY